MCEADPGALVKATLLQKSITVQYVAYLRYTRTAGVDNALAADKSPQFRSPSLQSLATTRAWFDGEHGSPMT